MRPDRRGEVGGSSDIAVAEPGWLKVGKANFLLAAWQVRVVVLLALIGVVIAALGALILAQSAARLPIAQVLHNE